MSAFAAIGYLEKHSGEYVPQKVGIGDASTFAGYCSFHDNALFQPAEQDPIGLDRELAFLLSTRAVALEVFRKLQGKKFVDFAHRHLDGGHPFHRQAEIQQDVLALRASVEAGGRLMAAHKALYDKAYADPTRGTFRYYALRLGQLLPAVTSGSFSPYTDMFSVPLQTHLGASALDTLAFNLTASGDQSIVTFGWMKPDGAAEKFARSFKALTDNAKANAAFIVALRAIENSYFSPSWWNAQSANKRKAISVELDRKDNTFNFEGTDNPTKADQFVFAEVVEEAGL